MSFEACTKIGNMAAEDFGALVILIQQRFF